MQSLYHSKTSPGPISQHSTTLETATSWQDGKAPLMRYQKRSAFSLENDGTLETPPRRHGTTFQMRDVSSARDQWARPMCDGPVHAHCRHDSTYGRNNFRNGSSLLDQNGSMVTRIRH